MNTTLVSVIIPVFNAEKHIDDCLNSICNQSFSFKYEIILVDDGSRDNSESIINRYVSKFDFVKYYRQENEGPSVARNLGIEVSCGKYIVFVDSDDWCDRNMIETAYKNIENNSADWAIHGYYIELKNERKQISIDNDIFVNENDKIGECIILLEEKMLIASPWTSIYKSEIIKLNNIRFNKNLSYGEDVLFNLEYLLYVSSIYISKDKLYHYRKTLEETLSSKYIPNRLETIMYNTNKRKEVYKKFNMNDKNSMIHFSNMFTRSLYGAIMNIFSDNCDLNYNTKLKILKSIIKNKEFESYIKSSNTNEKHILILKYLYATKLAFIMYISLKIINFIFKLKKYYLKIKN